MEVPEVTSKEAIIDYQRWRITIHLLLLIGIIMLGWRLSRQAIPTNTPKLLNGGSSIFGAVEFFRKRTEWCQAAMASTKTGNFTFYYGENQIVNLAGFQGRKTFFESQELSFAAG
jgi:hypothetical protein